MKNDGSKLKLGCIFLASGSSSRLGQNKLLVDFKGKALSQTVFESFPQELFIQNIVVTCYPKVALFASLCGFTTVENHSPADISHTINLGIMALQKGLDGCMLSVCDQPFMTAKSIGKLVDCFQREPDKIIAPCGDSQRGNPVIFPWEFLGELASLSPNSSGKAVINAHKNHLTLVEIPSHELLDIDTIEDLKLLK